MVSKLHNPMTPREKNDQRVRAPEATTFSQFAIAEADTGHNRFSAINRSTVTGAAPIDYPAQPKNSPWHGEQPVEPPIDASDCGPTFGAVPPHPKRKRKP